jgi:hypothetical protein
VRFCLIRMAEPGAADIDIAVVVPGTRKLAMLVPLGALPDFLALLYEALRGQDEQRCPACAEPMATLLS